MAVTPLLMANDLLKFLLLPVDRGSAPDEPSLIFHPLSIVFHVTIFSIAIAIGLFARASSRNAALTCVMLAIVVVLGGATAIVVAGRTQITYAAQIPPWHEPEVVLGALTVLTAALLASKAVWMLRRLARRATQGSHQPPRRRSRPGAPASQHVPSRGDVSRQRQPLDSD